MFEALRATRGLTIRAMSNLLGLSYQTVRRLCIEPGTPRQSTLRGLRKFFPQLNSARWRRWVYLISAKFELDVSDELSQLLSSDSIEIDAYSSLADEAARKAELAEGTGKPCSFYLHDDQLKALAKLSVKLNKSQAQIIRDHIQDLVTQNPDIASSIL